MMANRQQWNKVSYPINPGDTLPPERKVVAVWCAGQKSDAAYLPYTGYVRYGAGDIDSPYFVVYHGSDDRPVDVIAWCDCLPIVGPSWSEKAEMYNRDQITGRGFPARRRKPKLFSLKGNGELNR